MSATSTINVLGDVSVDRIASIVATRRARRVRTDTHVKPLEIAYFMRAWGHLEVEWSREGGYWTGGDPKNGITFVVRLKP